MKNWRLLHYSVQHTIFKGFETGADKNEHIDKVAAFYW